MCAVAAVMPGLLRLSFAEKRNSNQAKSNLEKPKSNAIRQPKQFKKPLEAETNFSSNIGIMLGDSSDEGLSDICRIESGTEDSIMAANFPNEISKYNKNVRYLKRLIKDTQLSLEEIRNNGSFYRGKC